MPPAFPRTEFQEFGKLASTFFPPALSDGDPDDPLQRRLHFQGAWLAVCYRYRACAEQSATFTTLFNKAMASDLWREWSEGEDHNYELEQCLYGFFMNALSVLESLGFCLYFVGAMIDSKNFHNVNRPRCITLKTTHAAFGSAFPNASATVWLTEMFEDPAFIRIDTIRNLLAHRLTGRRNIRSSAAIHPDGTYTQSREELWYIPGLSEEIVFDEKLVQRHFDDVTRLLTAFISASLKFVKSGQRAPGV